MGNVVAQTDYVAIENYLTIPEDQKQKQVILGQVSGLVIDKKDNLYVFHRADRIWNLEVREPIKYPVVLGFNSSGKLFYTLIDNRAVLPHMIDVDRMGDFWLVDVSSQHVFKASSNHKSFPHDMDSFGEPFVPGDDSLHFNLPTDISVLKDGSFYVADGYRNSRIIKFSKEGKYLFEWGKKGTGDGEFNIPHSVKYFNGKVYVADRENSRLQVFDVNGKFISKYDVGEKIGRLFAVTVDRNGNIYLSGMKEEGGGTLILSPDMKVKAELNTGGHDIAVDSKGVVYVTKGNNVTRFTPK
jgi:peptidylamidoglycolate lyase